LARSDAQAMPVVAGYPHMAYPDFRTESTGGFDFYRYLNVALKYRWLIAGTTLLAIVLAAAITFLITPIYRATSSIQIDRETINVTKMDNLQPGEAQSGQEFYQTQYELLASRSLAERVATSLNLSGDAAFKVQSKSLFGSIYALAFGKSVDRPVAAGSEEALATAVGRVMKLMSVNPVRGSRIAKISFDHPNPQVAQRIANAYAEVFISDNLERRYNATAYARKFLEDRLQQLRARLEESERQSVKYAEDQGIINLQDNKSLSSTDLEAVNAKLAEVRVDRLKKETLWKQAQLANGLGLKEILDSATIQENRKQRAQLSAQYQQKLSVFKPAFPEMVQLRDQIKELDRQMDSEVASVKQSIQAQYLAAKQEEDQLQTQLQGTKNTVIEQRSRAIQYNIIQREVDTNRQLYDGLLQRYKEIGVAGGVGTNNVSVVDRAILPEAPRSPKLSLNLLLGFIGGLILGGITAILLDYLDDSFKVPEDIERELGLPVVGVVPKPEAGSSVDDDMSDAHSGMAEAYRSLRTSLQFVTTEGLPRTMLVTSSRPSEGKTTTSISIARSMAQIGLKVLLIDGDLRNASLHKRLRQNNEVGLSNYLSSAMSPEDVVQATDYENVVLMTSGPLPPNPAELLAGPKLASLMNLASAAFDAVIIDGPPVMGLADAPVISSAVRATLMVVAAHETRRNTVRVALRRIYSARGNVVGAILNKFDLKQTGYGYGYGYGSYDYYGYASKDLIGHSKQ
jgi:capsular exopolysaccharide synthesis family protein